MSEAPGAFRQSPPERSDKRKALFWKTLERASKDVAEWPEYLKRAFGVKG